MLHKTGLDYLLVFLGLAFSLRSLPADQALAPYKDPKLPTQTRVEDLLSRMTIQEKADQMTQSVLNDSNPNNPQTTDVQKYRPTYGSYVYFINVRARNNVQKRAVEQSRLGIPALFGSDVIHGCYLTFPIPLAQACSWNPALVSSSCSYAAAEARRGGVDWVFAPMIDVTFDPRWGRIAEGYGESPYAASVFASAAVQGYQGKTLDSPDTVACTLKHFVAYGASEGGRDYSYTDVSPVRLWEMYLPPYRAGVQAGAAAVMSSFNDLDGIPMTANKYLLTDVLRHQFGFNGLIVTDWSAVPQLVIQGFARDGHQAIKLAIDAGIDIDMNSYLASMNVPSLVQTGEISRARIDTSVRRILKLKFDLGLFEHPYVPEDGKISPARVKDGENLAADLAAQSLVLLKNDDATLPISPQVKKIALIGPVASDQSEVLGSWRCRGDPGRTVSLEQGLRATLPPDASLTTEQGCDFKSDHRAGFAAAVKLAQDSDLVILCLGETAAMTGENASRSSLALPGVQEDLASAVFQTGKPVVLVISSGRPVDLQRLEPQAKSILAIWQPGTETGAAVAKVLLGEINPSGRLAVTWPRGSGQIPIYHNMHPRARGDGDEGAYQDIATTPQYEFGYGLSYTTFTYGPISLSSGTVRSGGELVASVTVTNTGRMDGAETAFWFVNHPVASITQPMEELKYFEKAPIPAGASHVFKFVIKPKRDLTFLNGAGQALLESGPINLTVGRQKISFQVEN